MSLEDGITELFADCAICRGAGCDTCKGRGVVLSEKGRAAQSLGDALMEELPRVSREDVAATVQRLRDAEAARRPRLATKDGRRTED